MNDIVYFVKESESNEELRYSLRSLKNFPHRKVWFYGGCPKGLNPDFHVPVKQEKDNKWKNVSTMLDMACNNPEITKEFWLFNDDFFIMEKIDNPKNYYRGDLYKRIVQLEDVYHGMTPYSKLLRACAKELESLGVTTKDFSLHIPLKIDKNKMLWLREVSNFEGFRSLYGNYFDIAKDRMNDCKIVSPTKEYKGGCYLSTDDKAFEFGVVGKQIREIFPDKCEYEL